MKPESRKNGFSLIELVIAMSIIVILVGTITPALTSEVKRQKAKKEAGELNTIQEAVENYFSDTSQFPTGILDLMAEKSQLQGWAGPYYSPGVSLFSSGRTKPEQDEWGRDYVAKATGDSTYLVCSAGPDAVQDTKDDISITVDVTHIRRGKTLEELEVINSAILKYNKVYAETDPLLADWNYIHGKLIYYNLLPSGGKAYEKDGWDLPYEPDPLGVTPVVKITSSKLK